MWKSGGILAVVAFLLTLGAATLLSPLCGPCVVLFAGLAAGYVAGLFDKPALSDSAAKTGAGAGAVGGAGALVGHLLGAVVNTSLMGPEGAAQLLRSFGLDTRGVSPATFYIGAFGGGCCLGLLDVALMAGLGALGGTLWFQLTGKNQAAAPPPPAA